MTNTVQINNLNETLAYIGDELSIIAEKPPVEINKEGVTPTETAETITIGDDSYSIGGSGGGFAPTLLGEFSSSTAQPAGSDLTINDCSNYSWLIVEYEKPNESMAGYNGPFRKIGWIPTDSMTSGSTQNIGISYNDVSATSMAVTAILPMISIKDSTHIRIIASSNFYIHRIWGI